MTLHKPFLITSRLQAGMNIGDSTIQLQYAKRGTSDGRTRYQWTIDLPDGTSHSGDDLQSGCNGGSLQEGFGSLLCFLGAAAESWSYRGADGENADLFPQPVVEWAAQHSDEISMAQLEIEESETVLIEE